MHYGVESVLGTRTSAIAGVGEGAAVTGLTGEPCFQAAEPVIGEAQPGVEVVTVTGFWGTVPCSLKGVPVADFSGEPH
jgi:hypothetical protein